MSELTDEIRARRYANKYYVNPQWVAAYSSYLAGVKRGRIEALRHLETKTPPEER